MNARIIIAGAAVVCAALLWLVRAGSQRVKPVSMVGAVLARGAIIIFALSLPLPTPATLGLLAMAVCIPCFFNP